MISPISSLFDISELTSKTLLKIGRLDQLHPPPSPVCVCPTNPPGHLGFHGAREVIDFDHYFGSNLSRWLPSFGWVFG